MDYQIFLNRKTQLGGQHGFEPLWMPDFLFDFQSTLSYWGIRRGRAAYFADCGMGKTILELVWAQNVVLKTNGRVLILTPLAVGAQTALEAERFGIECQHWRGGPLLKKIIVTNYEQLHRLNASDFVGVVCDESSILKNFEGKIKALVTEFMRLLPYRLLCTATAAPNDWPELGTSSEALGEMGYLDMLGKFFKNQQGTIKPQVYRHGGKRFKDLEEGAKWTLRGHAEQDFWRWVCSWARAVRKPSDLGGDDSRFQLPPLTLNQHVITSATPCGDYLISLPAHGLKEQQAERRHTIRERCEKAAELVTAHNKPAVAWCHLNPEGDLLEKMIPGCVQVSGRDCDEAKEEKLTAFAKGEVLRMVTKGKIAGFGLNWQHCAHQTYFPSHSFEQWYQCVRRSHRFGQLNPVKIDMISSEGEADVIKNLKRKMAATEIAFTKLVELMNDELHLKKINPFQTKETIPSWL